MCVVYVVSASGCVVGGMLAVNADDSHDYSGRGGSCLEYLVFAVQPFLAIFCY
jgi:hypothetical protein